VHSDLDAAEVPVLDQARNQRSLSGHTSSQAEEQPVGITI
jgi:hypothetical protein